MPDPCPASASGFHPGHVLPCVIDVGTNNEALRNDPLYMGLAQPRIKGPEYFAIIDEVGTRARAALNDGVMPQRWYGTVLQRGSTRPLRRRLALDAKPAQQLEACLVLVPCRSLQLQQIRDRSICWLS